MAVQVITTVTAAASSYDLTTLDVTKDELQIKPGNKDNDSWLARAISQVSASVANYCNRVFVVETVQDVIYQHRGNYGYFDLGGARPLQLSRWPVVAISSVTTTDTHGTATALVADTDYKLDADRGWLYRLSTVTGYPIGWGATMTTVTYQAGYTTIPPDVVEATLRAITQRYHARGRDPYMKTQTQPGLGEQSYWVGNLPGVSGAFTQEIEDLLDNYRVPVTV